MHEGGREDRQGGKKKDVITEEQNLTCVKT